MQVVTPVEARVSTSSPESSLASDSSRSPKHAQQIGSTGGGPRQQWIDVTFVDAPVTITHLSFFNYYCAAITISHTTMAPADIDQRMTVHQSRQLGTTPPWTVVVPKLTLMADPHCEDDAQGYHELTTAHFAPGFDHRRVTRLRICCLQPSPSWREYGLRQLRFYRVEVPPTPPLLPTPSLSTAERDLASTIVDHLVGLGQVASEIRTTFGGHGTTAKSESGGLPVSAPSRSAPARRSLVDHPASTLAPYLVGEWADELRLTGLDSMRSQSAKVPSSASNLGEARPALGTPAATAAAMAAMAMAEELRQLDSDHRTR